MLDDMDIGTRNSLTSLTAHEWQTILVYSIDHGIEDIVRKTLGKYDIHPTATVTSAPSRYSTKNIAKLSPPPPRLMEAGPQNQTESIEWTMATELYILKYNSVFREDFASTGVGKPVTEHIQKYTKKGMPLAIYDTRGFELSRENLKQAQQEIEEAIEEGAYSNDLSEERLSRTERDMDFIPMVLSIGYTPPQTVRFLKSWI